MEALNNQYWRAAERVRFTKRPQQRTSLEVLQRLLDHRGKDNENLVVVEISADKRHSQRMQMNRHMLLDECHKDVKPYGPAQKMLQKKQSLSRHDSRENLPAISRIHEAATVSQQSPALREGSRRGSISRLSRRTSQSPMSAIPTTSLNVTDHGMPLQLRDVRVLLSLSESTCLVRRGVLLLSFGHTRALVTAQRAFFIISDNDTSPVTDICAKIAEEPEDKSIKLPFELLVLEAVLMLALQTSGLSVDECLEESQCLLREMGKNLTPELLNRTYMLKGQLSRALQEVKGAQEEIERVQRDDSIMALMNLSDLYYDTETMDKLIEDQHAPTDHIEVLLDTYAYQLSAIANRLEMMAKQMNATEDLLNLRLESIQKNTFVANALFHMIITLLGLPTLVTGIWGMNTWSGHKFSLAGPNTKAPDFTPPDFPVDAYDNDRSLGVSWIFLWNSVGIAVFTVVLTCCVFGYVRRLGLGRVRV